MNALSSTEQQRAQELRKARIDAYVSNHRKSRVTAVVLAVLLGPLGLLYASVIGGVIMSILALVTGPTIVGPAVIWIASIPLSGYFAYQHNRRLRSKAELLVH